MPHPPRPSLPSSLGSLCGRRPLKPLLRCPSGKATTTSTDGEERNADGDGKRRGRSDLEEAEAAAAAAAAAAEARSATLLPSPIPEGGGRVALLRGAALSPGCWVRGGPPPVRRGGSGRGGRREGGGGSGGGSRDGGDERRSNGAAHGTVPGPPSQRVIAAGAGAGADAAEGPKSLGDGDLKLRLRRGAVTLALQPQHDAGGVRRLLRPSPWRPFGERVLSAPPLGSITAAAEASGAAVAATHSRPRWRRPPVPCRLDSSERKQPGAGGAWRARRLPRNDLGRRCLPAASAGSNAVGGGAGDGQEAPSCSLVAIFAAAAAAAAAAPASSRLWLKALKPVAFGRGRGGHPFRSIGGGGGGGAVAMALGVGGAAYLIVGGAGEMLAPQAMERRPPLK